MPSLETNVLFLGAALLLALTPGPDNVFVLMQSASQGRRTGLLVVLGLCTGLVIHTAMVTFGLAAIFAASTSAFTAMKFIGAGYLTYLAWQIFRAPVSLDSAGVGTANTAWGLYGRGIVMNLTNPKVALFFLAFLPQFVQAGAGPVALQLAWFGLLFTTTTLVAFGSIAVFAGWLGESLRRSVRTQRFMNRAAGAVFVGLALRLLLAER